VHQVNPIVYASPPLRCITIIAYASVKFTFKGGTSRPPPGPGCGSKCRAGRAGSRGVGPPARARARAGLRRRHRVFVLVGVRVGIQSTMHADRWVCEPCGPRPWVGRAVAPKEARQRVPPRRRWVSRRVGLRGRGQGARRLHCQRGGGRGRGAQAAAPGFRGQRAPTAVEPADWGAACWCKLRIAREPGLRVAAGRPGLLRKPVGAGGGCEPPPPGCPHQRPCCGRAAGARPSPLAASCAAAPGASVGAGGRAARRAARCKIGSVREREGRANTGKALRGLPWFVLRLQQSLDSQTSVDAVRRGPKSEAERNRQGRGRRAGLVGACVGRVPAGDGSGEVDTCRPAGLARWRGRSKGLSACHIPERRPLACSASSHTRRRRRRARYRRRRPRRRRARGRRASASCPGAPRAPPPRPPPRRRRRRPPRPRPQAPPRAPPPCRRAGRQP
jgi:hypothetical protein